MKRAHVILLAISVVLMAPVGFVVADSLTHSATAGVTYETNSGVTVTLGDDRDVAAVPFADDQTFADGDLRLSGSDAAVTVGDDGFDGDPVTLTEVDVDATGSLTVERTDLNRELTIEDGGAQQIQVRDYAVDNDTTDLAYASDSGVTVTLTGLPEGVGIGAIDSGTGEVLDSTLDASGGEATFELPAGTREVELQTVANELQVRNEADPDELITENASLRFRAFFDDEDGEEQVIEREVTDGTVDLEGLPADEQIVVTVREENADFVFRRILLDNIVQQSEIYLLPTNEPAAEIEFRVEDQTGRFDAGSTRFFVEKAITRDGETDYRVISGDELTAGGAFPTILEDSERYRLRVENDDGEQRVLGSYVVQGAQTEPIPIGDVQFGADLDDGAAMQASLRAADEDAAHNHEARIVYADPSGETDELEIAIEDSDGNAIRPTTVETLSGDADIYVETFPLDAGFDPEEDTATVTVTATSGLETEEFTQPIGDIPDVFTDVPLNPDLLELIFMGSIIAVAGLLVIVNPALAALVTPAYAALLSLVGLVPIPMAGVVLAGVVGVLAVVGNNMVFR